MRPDLNRDIKVEQFKEFYWLKEELQSFCRENGLSASGSKLQIASRIEKFLETGEIIQPARGSSRKVATASIELSLDTVIAENHRCSQNVRAFFTSVIPKFHFSTYIQDYFRNNVGKTYKDVVEAWYEEEERKKDPNYERDIGPQFEYNQFIRDFFADEQNRGKTQKEAIAAWNEIKKLPGSNKYKAK